MHFLLIRLSVYFIYTILTFFLSFSCFTPVLLPETEFNCLYIQVVSFFQTVYTAKNRFFHILHFPSKTVTIHMEIGSITKYHKGGIAKWITVRSLPRSWEKEATSK